MGCQGDLSTEEGQAGSRKHRLPSLTSSFSVTGECNTVKGHRATTAWWERLSTAPVEGIPYLVQWLCL